MSREVVVGIEFQNNIARIVELVYANEHVVVSKIKSVSIPPKTIINGDINDPSGLADQITRTLQDMESEPSKVVVCVDDAKFFKHLRQFPIIKQSELHELLEEEVANSALFFREDFKLGYQSFRAPGLSKEHTPYQHVLYGAVTQSQVESMQELFDMTGLNLAGVDIPSLSALRFFMYRNIKETPTLSIFVDDRSIDLNIFCGSDIYFTFTIQLDLDETNDLEIITEHILNRINYFLFSYSNHCFNAVMPTEGVFFSRNHMLDGLLSALQDRFESIMWEKVNGKSIINVDASLTVDESQLMDYLLPIGLGLKCFEVTSKKSLNLSQENQSISPLIDQEELKIAGVVFAFCLLVIFGVNFFATMSQDRISSDLVSIKTDIKELQSGEFIARQNELASFQAKLKKYNRIRDESFSKTDFLKDLVDGLPEDLSFKSVRVFKDLRVIVHGSAAYQDSIYQFYNHLKDHYSKVELSSIVTKYDKNSVPMNNFEVSFKRVL
jgi:hypothetical protein